MLCFGAFGRRAGDLKADAGRALGDLRRRLDLSSAGSDGFDTALVAVDDSRAMLASGAATLDVCAQRLGVASSPRAVIEALALGAPEHGQALESLFTRGIPCAFRSGRAGHEVEVEGRAGGAIAWLRLSSAPRLPAGSSEPAERPLAAFIDAYPDPAWVVGRGGKLAWVNAAWLRATGAANLDLANAAGVTLDAGADAMVRAAQTGERPAERVRWTALAGVRRALLIRATPLEDGAVGVWTSDVTQREAAADTLRRHVAAHELTLDQIDDAVAVFGRDRRLVFHNDAFARLWGLEPAWLAGQPSHAEWLDQLRRLGRLPETPDYIRFRKDELARYERLGAHEPVMWRLPGDRTLRVLGQPHPAGGVILVFSDITPELRLNSQFNHLIQVQRATLDKLADAVAVFGPDGRLQLHNEAFGAMAGVTSLQMARAGGFDDVVELCLRSLHDLAFWRELKGRITSPDPTARAPVSGEMVSAEGRRLAWQSRPLPDGATLIAFSDVTDARALGEAVREREAALAQSERLKRDFVANVSHQLRTPLTSILGYSELLERSAAAGDGARTQAAAVRQAAGQLARLIDKVLDIAQLDSGEAKLRLAVVDVAELIRDAADRRSSAARSAGLTLSTQGDRLGLIVADRARLGQVLDHLLDNAIRHTPSGGAVTVSARREAGALRLQVADTGRGIPFHVQAHIFDRFSAEDRAGPGLGLALVKAWVELHGGWVALESDPGVGATITCHLPETAGAAG